MYIYGMNINVTWLLTGYEKLLVMNMTDNKPDVFYYLQYKIIICISDIIIHMVWLTLL